MQFSSDQAIAPPGDRKETFTLDVKDMKCASCVKAVESHLLQQVGVISAIVDLVNEVATVECEAGVKPALLADKLTELGFPAQPCNYQTELADKERASTITPAQNPQLKTQLD
jgi:P-type Cu2+ transporter